MKTKLVLWGKNAEEQRVLTAIELKAKENKVGIYIFPTAVATDDFANELMQNWRDGKEVAFPEGYEYSERELSVTESILPEGIALERSDLLSRAQTEWHFVVLSSKLHDVYQSEAQEIKDKINKLDTYDSQVWDQLKGFWGKVQEQVKEQNLFREHADSLRGVIDGLFNDLKGLRTRMESEFQSRSKETAGQFSEMLDGVEKRIGEGTRLSSVFEELKGIQRKFRDAKFTREDQTRIWKRLDSAFKAVKEKRFGPDAAKDNTAMTRLTRRMEGLKQAIVRMEKSIQRDVDDLEFQQRKIERTDGQLESQIRQAKIKMIEERVRSKKERLADMRKTETQVQKQIERQKVRDDKRNEREKIEEAKKAAQAKIQEKMDAAAAERQNDEKLSKAAAALKGKEAVAAAPAVAAVVAAATETTETAKEEVKEATETVQEPVAKVEEVVAETTAEATETVEETLAKVEEATEETSAAPESEESLLGAVGTMVSETMTDMVDTVKAVATVVGDKAMEAMGMDEDSATATAETAEETATEQAAEIQKVTAEAEANASNKIQEEMEAAAEVREEEASKIEELATNGLATLKEKASEAAAKVAETISDAVESVKDATEG